MVFDDCLLKYGSTVGRRADVVNFKDREAKGTSVAQIQLAGQPAVTSYYLLIGFLIIGTATGIDGFVMELFCA